MSLEKIKKIGAELIIGDDDARALMIEVVRWLQEDFSESRRIHAAMHRLFPSESRDFHILLASMLCLDADDFETVLQAPVPTDAELAAVEL